MESKNYEGGDTQIIFRDGRNFIWHFVPSVAISPGDFVEFTIEDEVFIYEAKVINQNITIL